MSGEAVRLQNREIAALFARMADILEIQEGNPFRIRSYRGASRAIGDMTQDVAELASAGRLTEIPGIGRGISDKIREYLETGRIAKYDEIRKGVPDGLVAILSVPGLGPKTVALLRKELGVESMKDLEAAVESGAVSGLPGMGEKKVENILRGLKLVQEAAGRLPLGVALPVSREIIALLAKKGVAGSLEPAGSLRRRCETVGDIDILATGKKGGEIIDSFTSLPMVREVLAAGETKGSVIVEGGLQIDLRVVPALSFGAALQYFTGSKSHNIHLRRIAKEKGLKINEYGIFKGSRRLGGRTEAEIYKRLGMKWIPPELREDRGEIEAAEEGKLPRLVRRDSIRGDLHLHSRWSDGSSSIEALAARAKLMGYDYLVISDHSQSLRIARGLSVERLREQISEIRKLNSKIRGIRILAGSEVDILNDGRLDFPDDLLAELDYVTASVHSGFKQSADRITGRIVKAMENPYVTSVGHPTGRLIGEREAYGIDTDRVLSAARETGTALELNAYYQRLDAGDLLCRRAGDMSVPIAIGTDAHSAEQMWMMDLGVSIARRGWLEKKDVLNTLSFSALQKFVRKKRMK